MKFIVSKESWGADFCPCCGLNTALLAEEHKIKASGKTFCLSCYKSKKSKKQVTPKDFYILFQKEHQAHNAMVNNHKESICKHLPYLEIAFLYGEQYKEDAMYLDLYCDIQSNVLYFRLSIADAECDPWLSSETYHYLSVTQALSLLNKNGIHIFDGMTEENCNEFFEFSD